jgi:hypothetical protein
MHTYKIKNDIDHYAQSHTPLQSAEAPRTAADPEIQLRVNDALPALFAA